MSPDEAEIRRVLAALTQAIREKDAARAIALLADDAVTFDLAPPLALRPDQTHDPSLLDRWFDTWEGPIESEALDLRVEVGGNLGYAYALQHMSGHKRTGDAVAMWFRATACLRREHGRWRITHMHNSVPMMMDGSGKAALDLAPSQ